MNDLIKTATAFLLNENAPKNLNESVKFVSKGIFTQDGKKVDGERKSKLFLAAVDENGYVHDMNWKEWSSSDLKDTSSDLAKKQFIDRLAKQIKAFNKRVDLNTWLKAGNRSFVDIVNYILKLDSNIKYPKTGLKEDLELDESLTAADFKYIESLIITIKDSMRKLDEAIMKTNAVKWAKTIKTVKNPPPSKNELMVAYAILNKDDLFEDTNESTSKIKVVYVQKIGGKHLEILAKDVKFDKVKNEPYLLIGSKESGTWIPLSHVIEIVPNN